MTYDIEIVLRTRDYAVTEKVQSGTAAAAWTDEDVEEVLKSILLAIDKVKNPEATERFVALRDFSWIVEPTSEGVVIAIEIPMGAAVAGPFAVEQPRLDAMIARVLAAHAPVRPVIH